MKFNIGKLGLELLFSWNQPTTELAASKPPVATQAAPVTPTTGLSSIRDVVYTITSAFEGGPIGKINYDNLTGNFDGQGYSIGFLQWCVGQGSDVQLFHKLEQDYPGVLYNAFGKALYDEFMANFDKPLETRLAWVKKAVNNSKGQIEPNWKRAFNTLCATKEFQSIQRFFAEAIFQKAAGICKEYGLKTNRALMLAFDICTQNGSISTATKKVILDTKAAKEKLISRKLTEKELLEIIAIKRAEASNPQWIADVKARKLTIVYGTGKVHGDTYDLSKMGLDDKPFLL